MRDVRKVNLYKSIAWNNIIPVSFHLRQCESFTVPQSTSTVDMSTEFDNRQYAGVYKSFYDFASRYYGIDNLLARGAVNPVAFKSL